MRTIWKYELEVDDTVDIRMPSGAEILALAEQYGTPCLWALVETKNELVDRVFRVYVTGHPVDHAGTYIGTFQLLDGAFVGHVFEVDEVAS